MTRKFGTKLLAAAVLLSGAAYLGAQDAQKEAQNKLLAKRAAEADAYRKLAECIKGLQITSSTYVKDFVTESDTIQTSVNTFLRGARFGQPRWESDGACTIEAEVTVAKLVEELKSIHQRHYKGNVLKATDFESIKQYYKKDIVQVTGMGAPRPDTPPDVPGEEIATTGKAPDPFIPQIWREIGPQARLMAKRAAEVDAMRKLVERIKGLRITSDTLVRDFVTESDVITAEAREFLVGAREVKTYYHDNELIVEVVYQVPTESVVTTIKSLHKRHYKGDRVTGMDIEKVTKEIKRQTFEATGMGVPPPAQIKAVAVKIKMDIPDWATQPAVTAEGKGVSPEDKAGTPQGKLMAARAAELDAKRRLAEQVWGLTIDSSTTVKDFVTERDEIRTQLDAYIQGSYVKSTRWDGEEATVVVELMPMQVWEVVHTYIKIRKA